MLITEFKVGDLTAEMNQGISERIFWDIIVALFPLLNERLSDQALK
jgi:hypothetical protein